MTLDDIFVDDGNARNAENNGSNEVGELLDIKDGICTGDSA